MAIQISKPYLPPLEKYSIYLRNIWESSWVTSATLVHELEKGLKNYLDVKHLFFVCNGTTALQIAVKAFCTEGKIITTPFSYVATSSSIAWVGCKPVFVDIEEKTLNIDANKIEDAITKDTTAILATNIYGIPCDVEKIRSIANKHKLKVIYDNAHGFGAKYKGRSLASYGDISTLSFHATKLFHTIEGGALVTSDDKLAHKISYMRNFGHKGHEDYWGLGINAKNSELHAAMGLCILPKVNSFIAERKRICKWYDELLMNKTITLIRPTIAKDTKYNYSFYPILLPSEKNLLKIKKRLENNQIYPRRYFYPSLSSLNYVEKCNTPIANDIAKRILCLPLYQGLSKKAVKRIAGLIV